MAKINTLDEAINRWVWRLKKSSKENTPFKPNEVDLEAFNYIVVWINSEKKKNVLKHNLFAKLYILKLVDTIRKNESDILENLCQKEVSRILDTPLPKFVEAFQHDLYQNQIKRILERVSNQGLEVLTEESIKQRYDYEYISNKLSNMISEALNKFS